HRARHRSDRGARPGRSGGAVVARRSTRMTEPRTPQVGVIMGSDSDWPTMTAAAGALAEFNVPYEVRVVSAHRTPKAMLEYAATAADRGLRVIIAGAGGAAHLP